MREEESREAARLRDQASRMREMLGPSSAEELREARIRSVYANLAIDDPTVTLEEVRGVLETDNGGKHG